MVYDIKVKFISDQVMKPNAGPNEGNNIYVHCTDRLVILDYLYSYLYYYTKTAC